MPTDDNGRGELARTMALLWGDQRRPRRGPKPGLNVDRIVQAAIEIADAEGQAALSMRRVAEALGVGTMSLYTYVRNKAELLELMLDAVIGEHPPAGAESGGWRAGLERFARQSLAGYQRHPWLLGVSLSRGLMGPNQAAALEAVLGTLSGIGLRHDEMMASVQSLVGYVRGAAYSAAQDAQLAQRSGMSDEQWWDATAPLLDPRVDADRFPVLHAVFGGEPGSEWVDPFEFGLGRLLDGIEALVRSRAQ